MSRFDPLSDARLGRVVDADYGQTLLALYRDGPGIIHFDRLLGLIAFPSMHIVMAMMCTWHVRGTWLLLPMLTINLFMVPAIIVHGGHHVIDLIAGIILFALMSRLARWILRSC